jgi:hypothetical protein
MGGNQSKSEQITSVSSKAVINVLNKHTSSVASSASSSQVIEITGVDDLTIDQLHMFQSVALTLKSSVTSKTFNSIQD